MRRMTTRLAAFLFAATLVFTNVQCKKDDDDDKSKTEILTSGQWRITAITITPGIDLDEDGTVDTDVYKFTEACDRDDYLVFSANGTYEDNEGATKCDTGDPQTASGNWAFNDNETKMSIDGGSANIDEFTSNKIRLSTKEIDERGTEYTTTLTLSK